MITPILTPLANALVHVDWRVLTLLRAAVLVVLAALVVRALRHAPARHRHTVWSLTLLLIAGLPFAGKWIAAPGRVLLPSTPVTAPGVPPAETLATVLWLAGVLAVVARIAAGLVLAQRLRTTAEPIRELVWDQEVETARSRLRFRTPIDLRRSASIDIPMVFGWWRPVVLLPWDSADWTAERRRAVVLHEVAHLSRRDWVTRLPELVLCAAYWFHPLIWWAAARRRVEAERVCDEAVIAQGISPSSYATHLLAFAGGDGSKLPSSAVSIASSHFREMETRIQGILSPATATGRLRVLAPMTLVGFAGASLLFSAPGPVCAMTQSTTAALEVRDVPTDGEAASYSQPR